MLALSSFLAGLRARSTREEGQALVEYALILGLVSVVAIALLAAIGENITDLLARVTDALASAMG
jgi:Flp pilus assembly pilin Flp